MASSSRAERASPGCRTSVAWDEAAFKLPSTLRQTDLVWEVEGADGRRRLLHIELQTAVDPEIGERLAEYMSRLWRRDHLPIRSVVVYLRPAERIPAAPFVIPWEENDDSQISRYGVVRLWEVPAERVLNSPSYALWPLAPLLAGATDETTVAVAERLAAVDAPRQERGDLIGLLVGLAGLRRAGAAYETLVTLMRRHAMLDELLRESSMAEMFIKEGREEGGRQMAQVALEGRFGTLPADLLAALGKSDEGTLREVVAHIATDALEQVRARLGLGPQAGPQATPE